MKTNGDFGSFIAPLVKPMYVLQMARSKKRWSAEARLKHIGQLRAACIKVIDRIDRAMPGLCEEANQETLGNKWSKPKGISLF